MARARLPALPAAPLVPLLPVVRVTPGAAFAGLVRVVVWKRYDAGACKCAVGEFACADCVGDAFDATVSELARTMGAHGPASVAAYGQLLTLAIERARNAR